MKGVLITFTLGWELHSQKRHRLTPSCGFYQLAASCQQVAASLLTSSSCSKSVKVGTHEATNRCNTLLQHIALCVQSSDKSFSLIAAMGCSDKSPGVNTSTFGCRSIKILSPRQNFVAATCRTKLNQFDFVRHVAATKFCRGDKIFDKILLFTRWNLLLRRAAATCCSDLSSRVFRPLKSELMQLEICGLAANIVKPEWGKVT